jgi:molecular chaperone GrpE
MEEKNLHSEDEVVIAEEGDLSSDELEFDASEELSLDRIKKMREKLKVCEREKQEHLDGWQRARADFLNYKRRTEEDSKRQNELTTARYIEDLLPLLDSFGLATKGKAWDEADAHFKAGFEMIRSQLDTILKDLKVERFDPLHTPFNPSYHEALSERHTDDVAHDGVVLETIQPGYKRGDTIIRAARVVVGTCRP